MMKNIASARCNSIRECGREDCILKMLFRGYTHNPSNDSDRRNNANIERAVGKGFFPLWKVVGDSETTKLICNSFEEKR